MKVIAKPIEMVAWFTEDGIPHPVRFRILSEDETVKIIKIGKILFRQTEKLAGNLMVIFRCQSEIDGQQKVYEIKYELCTMKWMLFKM